MNDGPGTTPGSGSLFSARFAVLGDPPCDITFAPDAALGKLGDGLGEAGVHRFDCPNAGNARVVLKPKPDGGRTFS